MMEPFWSQVVATGGLLEFRTRSRRLCRWHARAGRERESCRIRARTRLSGWRAGPDHRRGQL